MSSNRLKRTRSFQAGRTMGVAVPPAIACKELKTIGSSLGACSVSIRIQSKPAPAMTSTARLLQRLFQRPICGRPSRIACLKGLMGIRVFIARFSWWGLIVREKGLNVQPEKPTWRAGQKWRAGLVRLGVACQHYEPSRNRLRLGMHFSDHNA